MTNRKVRIDNYIINDSIEHILEYLKLTLTNGKLKEINSKHENIVVTCPHHANGTENKAACSIYIGSDPKIPYGFANCFVCGFKGPFEYFVAECLDCGVEQAKRWLLTNFETEKLYETLNIGDAIDLSRNGSKAVSLDKSILDDYQSWCPYLGKRKLSRAICEKFNVKYDPTYRQVIFPCYDEAGRLIMMPKRSIDTKIFYLDSGIEKPVYNLNIINNEHITKCIITEGPFDCLTGWQYGVPTIATLGAISEEQIAKINKSCIEVLYLMFDNDFAGRKFAEFIKSRISKRIITVDIQIPSPYKDINDLSYEKFWELLNNSKSL